MGMQDAIRDAAELVEEWDAHRLRWKLYRVPGEVLGEDGDAYLLHGFDGGNVRRVDQLIGPCQDQAWYGNIMGPADRRCLTVDDVQTLRHLEAGRHVPDLAVGWLARMEALGYIDRWTGKIAEAALAD